MSKLPTKTKINLPITMRIGINALVFKNPITGVAKRILSLYGNIASKQLQSKGEKKKIAIYFFSPYPITISQEKEIARYGISFDDNANNLIVCRQVITPTGGWLSKIAGGKELCEWWWIHFRIPWLLRKYKIDVYDSQWGGGLPTRFPYRLLQYVIPFPRPIFLLTIHDLIPLVFHSSIILKKFPNHSKSFKLIRLFSFIGIRITKGFEMVNGWLFRLRVLANLNLADQIITVSPAVERQLRSYFVTVFSPVLGNKSIYIHPNGVSNNAMQVKRSQSKSTTKQSISRSHNVFNDVQPIHQNLAILQAAQGLQKTIKSTKKPTNPFIFYIGGFSPRKNVITLIRALNDNHALLKSKYILVLAGKPNHYFHRVLKPLMDKATFPIMAIGYVDDEELPNYYRQCELFCYPSLAEGFGMPPLEGLVEGATIIIDETLPINQNQNKNDLEGSFIVDYLFHQTSQAILPTSVHIRKAKLQQWWKQKVIALNLNEQENITAVKDLSYAIAQELKQTKTKNNFNFVQTPQFPLHWNNLAQSYFLLLEKMFKQSKQ